MASFSLISKKSNIKILLLLSILSITSCTKDGDNLVFVPTEIESISPTSGPGDTEVTISGISFGTNPNAVSVFFNDVEAIVNSVTETEITAIVPRGAQTGTVRVVLNGENVMGPEFTYVITSAQVSTLIRSEMPGDMDGPVAQASFSALWGLLTDEEGSVFISDYGNNKIRKINTDNIVSTVTGMTGVIGDMDGTFAEATFNNPRSMAMDSQGNIVVSDLAAQKIRRINLSSETVETIAGTGDVGLVNGDGSIAQFAQPIGVVIDNSDNIYVSELGNATIRRIAPDNTVNTLVGTGVAGFVDGPADTALISFTAGMAIAANGDIVFADAGNHSVRRVTTQGIVSTIAGTGTTGDVNGEGDIAQFASPLDVAVDSQGNIFVVDFGNQKIKRIDTDGMVTTYAGTGEIGFMDGIPSIATFNNPRNLFIDENDVIYVGTDDAIRLITPEF
ncbi:IPT/TIG domain-containing protein [uncultured Aquimarina sp.]|uniref:IPT/TIG domain-containing protein n=1 Tax=uncultured Aquimarina sp. TaxID=575652 RepID=UPI00261D9AC6|nr:IPT/TIG domain-containing protein [uncultured Aquimarina sp.]